MIGLGNAFTKSSSGVLSKHIAVSFAYHRFMTSLFLVLTVAWWASEMFYINCSKNIMKRIWGRKHAVFFQQNSEPISYISFDETGTASLDTELWTGYWWYMYTRDRPHVLLKYFLILVDAWLFCDASFCSELCMFLSTDFLNSWLQSVQDIFLSTSSHAQRVVFIIAVADFSLSELLLLACSRYGYVRTTFWKHVKDAINPICIILAHTLSDTGFFLF